MKPEKTGTRTVLVLALLCLILALTGLALKSFAYAEVHGASMTPTLEDGDQLLLHRSSSVVKGEYLIFTTPASWAQYNRVTPEARLIKRVIAAPGDTIKWDGRNLFVNDRVALAMPTDCRMNNFVRTLTAQQAFVAGDNAAISLDSRAVMCAGSYSYLITLQPGQTSGRLVQRF